MEVKEGINSVQLVATNPIDLLINNFYLVHETAFWVSVGIMLVIGLTFKIRGE